MGSSHFFCAAFSSFCALLRNLRAISYTLDESPNSAGSILGGFCVWLDVSERGGDEAAAVRLYRDAGVRVIPGSYLSRPQNDGFNPGTGYIRLALVSDSESTAEALHRLVETLD